MIAWAFEPFGPYSPHWLQQPFEEYDYFRVKACCYSLVLLVAAASSIARK